MGRSSSSDWHEGNPLPAEVAGAGDGVGEDTAVSSGAEEAPVETVEDPSVGATDTGTSADVSGTGVPSGIGDQVAHEAGVDSGVTEVSRDFTKPSEGFGAEAGVSTDADVSDATESGVVSEHVDESGADLTKNDEVPSARDGLTASLEARGGIAYSDGVCPMLADEDAIRRERETVSIGSVELTSRQPYNVLTNPMECPTCHKQVEANSLTFDPKNLGVRDCAVAIAHKNHPVAVQVQDALDNENPEKAKRISQRHPLGARLLSFLGFHEADDEKAAV